VTSLLRELAGRLLGLPVAAGWALAGLWFALIWVASSAPASASGGHPAWGLAANLAHAPIYGILALWLVPALADSAAAGVAGPTRLPGRVRVKVLALVLLAGVVDELHQALGAAGRQASLLDLATDLAGAACALWLVALLERERVPAAELGRRLALAALACLAAAALATWAPRLWPGVPGL
jgi:hypothetical protein